MEKPLYPMRINKYLALKNYATRRGADELIKKGHVSLNGKRAVVGDHVNASDTVVVKLQDKPKPFIYMAYNKPRGIESTSPIKGVFPIGGLDKDAHGLMILTNDGRITEKLLSPIYAHEKEYRVSTKETLRESFKRKMEAGVVIGKEKSKKCKIEIINENTFRVILTEEKRNEIKRMCSALFYEVTDLERTRIINIRLGSIKSGAHRAIEANELKTFLTSLGL